MVSETREEGAVSEEAPPFDCPWQAQAFALAVSLLEAGHFTRGEWSEALGRAIAEDEARHGLDQSGARYYDCWLVALEALLKIKGLTETAAIERRRRDWEAAYLRTPHGQPVELRTHK